MRKLFLKLNFRRIISSRLVGNILCNEQFIFFNHQQIRPTITATTVAMVAPAPLEMVITIKSPQSIKTFVRHWLPQERIHWLVPHRRLAAHVQKLNQIPKCF